MKYIASCSFGKDSIATIILAHIHNEPLDLIVYSEVMFDENISGENPLHRDFIYYKDVGGCWGCGISLVFDELLKSYKALELSSQKQLDQLKINNEELERKNKKLKSIIKQAIEDFNLEIGTPQYEILLNKSKELGVIKE